MANVKAIKHVTQLNSCFVVRYKVLMTNFVFSLNLVDDQFGVTISFKVPYPNFFGDLEADQQSIVLCYII